METLLSEGGHKLAESHHDPVWWQRGIIYQIYPRSFMDGNGDGIGDLPGIIGRLDYLVELGIDAIWLSPIYPSPMADFGYDVSDFNAIHPIFGTLEVFDRLVAEAHRRGLKLIIDFVPNHSSDRHPWFRESRSSRDNPRRDWYIWRDPAPDGGPPNNWLSHFGGGAWDWDEATGQYYYHAFLKEQPDLNWRNPDVRRAMHDVLRFWMGRGVDGFRIDVLWLLIKDDRFRDNPVNPAWRTGDEPIGRLLPVHTADQPEIHDVITELRQVIDEYEDRVMIGEIYLPVERLVAYYGKDLSGAHMPFNFQLIQVPWSAHEIGQMIIEYERALPTGGWPNWVLGNHDKHRIASRVGPAQARIAALLLLTLRGTPTMYYGDELGMPDVPIPPDRVQDPFEKNVPGIGLGRDPARTPMRWDAGESAGFTTGEPWLPVGDDWRTVNVAAQSADERSMLTLYRRLIALRRAEPALAIGGFAVLRAEAAVVVYVRQHEGRRFIIALNFGSAPQPVTLPAAVPACRIVLSTLLDRTGEVCSGSIGLRGEEGMILEVSTDGA